MTRIYISPSIQENNIGVGDYGTEEYRMNQLADYLVPLLENDGITVYRNSPQMSLSQVVADSNSRYVDYHIALHSNAAYEPGTLAGSEVYIYRAGGPAETMATEILSRLDAIAPNKGRGIKVNPTLYELKNTRAPALLIEVGYHDNPVDAYWIINNMPGIAAAIADGILTYLDYS